MKTNPGLIHIYTGDGKGKTTAAVGLATRALGKGMAVCYVSFHKRPEKYGYSEMQSLEKLGAKVINLVKGHPHLDKSLSVDVIKQETAESISVISNLMAQKIYDLLILDEILISVRDKFLNEAILIDLIQNKPEELELVLTGRGATGNVIDLAHYVTSMEKIKHPYDQGTESRRGIEY